MKEREKRKSKMKQKMCLDKKKKAGIDAKILKSEKESKKRS